MKILYVPPSISNSGGIARVVSQKANYFCENLGHEVHVLIEKENQDNFFYKFSNNIKWHFVPQNSLIFKLSKEINLLVKNCKIDVVIICDVSQWFVLPWLLSVDCPVFFETHIAKDFKKNQENNFYSKCKRKLLNILKTKALQIFTSVVFETERGSKEWNIKNTTVIPNALSFFSDQKSSLQNKRVINVSRHSPEKGLDQLLNLWKIVVTTYPDWQLDIYGEWNEELKYQKLAQELNVNNNVNFFAPVVKIQEKYLESSIYLMTSTSEAFGMVLIEAMECGLPCIAFDCPNGPRTIIENNSNGFLILENNFELYLSKILELIKDENLRIKLGKNAIESVKKYNQNNIMNEWDLLLKKHTKVI